MRDEKSFGILSSSLRPPPSSLRSPSSLIPSKFGLMLEGELDQRVAAVQFEFSGDVVAMMFNGADTDAQFSGDAAAGLAFGDQFQDAAFGGRELVERGFRGGKQGGAGTAPDEIGRERRADVVLAGDHRFQAT